MMELLNWYLEVLKANGFVGFLILCSVYYLLKFMLFVIPLRLIRYGNLQKHGWPPEHCDADGDILKGGQDD